MTCFRRGTTGCNTTRWTACLWTSSDSWRRTRRKGKRTTTSRSSMRGRGRFGGMCAASEPRGCTSKRRRWSSPWRRDKASGGAWPRRSPLHFAPLRGALAVASRIACTSASAVADDAFMRKHAVIALAALLPLPFLCAQQPAQQPAPPAPPAPPKVGFLVKDRHGHATPDRIGATHTGGGNTDVAQPRDDTLIITMTGVAVAAPHPCKTSSAVMNFDLNQDLELAFADPKLKKARLTMEA